MYKGEKLSELSATEFHFAFKKIQLSRFAFGSSWTQIFEPRRGYNDVNVFLFLLRSSQLIPVCTSNSITPSTFNIFVYSNNPSVYPQE